VLRRYDGVEPVFRYWCHLSDFAGKTGGQFSGFRGRKELKEFKDSRELRRSSAVQSHGRGTPCAEPEGPIGFRRRFFMAGIARWVVLLVLLSGCSPKGVSPEQLRQIVQEGKDVTWPDGRTIHVQRRQGSQLEGVRLVRGQGQGAARTVEANRGLITVDPDGETIRVTLYDARMRIGTNSMGSIKEFSVLIPK
jgi:hypothetical protein